KRWNDKCSLVPTDKSNDNQNPMTYLEYFLALARVYLFFGIIALHLLSCNNGNQNKVDQGEEEIVQRKKEEKIDAAGPSCYLFATERDTVYLKLIVSDNGKVTGDLNYDFYERDGNTGFIEGEIRG